MIIPMKTRYVLTSESLDLSLRIGDVVHIVHINIPLCVVERVNDGVKSVVEMSFMEVES